MKHLVIALVAGFILINLFMFVFTFKTARTEQRRLETSSGCIVYYKDNIPTKIEVQGFIYPLNQYGEMDLKTKTFLNPWHKQTIDNGCDRVEILR